MNLNLLPSEPYATRLLYQTYTTCAYIKNIGFRKIVYYPTLICGISISILVGCIEFAVEKALQNLRRSFLEPHLFEHREWKSQCRTLQLETAIQTVGEFAFDEIHPTLFLAYGLLLKETHYYFSIRSSSQWIYMDENSPLIREMGEQLQIKMNQGMRQILRLYAKDIASGIDEIDRHSEIFLKQICSHYDMMEKNMGFSLKKKYS